MRRYGNVTLAELETAPHTEAERALVARVRELEGLLRDADAALVQGIGALTIDAMIDERGEAFGTTTVAMEQMRASRRKIDAALAEEP